MLWRSDQGEDRPDIGNKSGEITTENKNNKKSASSSTMSREELLASDPKAREMYEKLRSLRSSVDSIKDQNLPETDNHVSDAKVSEVSAEEKKAAEEAVLKKAREEAVDRQRRQIEQARRQAKQMKAIQEANRRAEEKRLKAEEMKKMAAQASRQAAINNAAQAGSAEGIIAAGHNEQNERHESHAQQDAVANAASSAADEKQSSSAGISKTELNNLKDNLEATKERQGAVLGKLSDIADDAANILNERQHRQVQQLTEAQERAKLERDRQRQAVKEELEASRAKRLEEEEASKKKHQELEAARKRDENRKKAELQAAHATEVARIKADKQAEAARIKQEKAAEAARIKAERAAAAARMKAQKKAQAEAVAAAKKKAEAERKAEEERIKEERKELARQKWRERDEMRQARRRARRAEQLKAAEEELKIHQEIERYRRQRKEEDERIRLQRIREEDAAKGGGLVSVHDMTIKTEINKRENINLIDLLGIKTKEERNAKTDEERMALRLEREYRREDARAKYSFNRMIRMRTWENSGFGRTYKRLEKYCADHTRGIITASASLATIFVVISVLISYGTAYEYAYNGTTLGVVNNKDDVLAVTDIVEQALSEETDKDITIGADDITFNRIFTFGDNSDIDSTEEVLNRLTYMSDVKVKSYGIYVDGTKVGAVQTKSDAQEVLESIKNMYTSKMEKSEVLEAVFLENVNIERTTTKLGNLRSAEEMVSILTTDTDKETVHTSIAGETTESIAKEYGTTEKKVLKDNPTLESGKVSTGTAVVIKENAPVVTVLITEKVSYTEDIEFETETTKDDNMYEGDKDVTQKGEKGSRDITSEITTSNGTQIEENILEEEVTKEPVTKKVTVGTKERPPTVGDGNFSCPVHASFTYTSGFGSRWGSFHKGVDLACPTGTKVYAADGGTVITASYQPSYGNLVVIDHQNGYTTKYAHNSKIDVKVGDKVYEGQLIARVGSTGNSTGPHCHFEVRYNDEPKNPLNFIKLDHSDDPGTDD